MFPDDSTFDYVRFDSVTPEKFLDGVRTQVRARLTALAQRQNVTDAKVSEAMGALEELFATQRKKLTDTDPATKLPTIGNWWFGKRLDEHFIIVLGEVTGHPLLRDGAINTSPVYFWDRERNLIATQNTIYRMGTQLDLDPVVDPSP